MESSNITSSEKLFAIQNGYYTLFLITIHPFTRDLSDLEYFDETDFIEYSIMVKTLNEMFQTQKGRQYNTMSLISINFGISKINGTSQFLIFLGQNLSDFCYRPYNVYEGAYSKKRLEDNQLICEHVFDINFDPGIYSIYVKPQGYPDLFRKFLNYSITYLGNTFTSLNYELQGENVMLIPDRTDGSSLKNDTEEVHGYQILPLIMGILVVWKKKRNKRKNW